MSVYDHAPRGWHPLLDDLIADLGALNNPFTLYTCRAYMGVMAISAESTSLVVRDRIRDTEVASLTTCEECGSRASICRTHEGNGRWKWRTLCGDCAAELGFLVVPDPPDVGPILRRMEFGASVSCSPGWWWLCEDLNGVLAQRDSEYLVNTVKDKFCTLRYYVFTRREELKREFTKRTWDVMLESEHVCQVCGAEGEYRERGEYWAMILCEACWAAIG